MPYSYPVKDTATLVEMLWGPMSNQNKNSWRLIDIGQQHRVKGVKFDAEPNMRIELPAMTGEMQPEVAKIFVPLTAGGTSDRLSDGLPHPTVVVNIMELLTPEPPQYGRGSVESRIPTLRYLFGGYLSLGVRNPAGRDGIVELQVSTPKVLLQGVTLGVPANALCIHNYTNSFCRHTTPRVVQGVTITNIASSGYAITTDDPGGAVSATSSALPGGLGPWDDGYMEREGLRIKIKVWGGAGSTSFTLVDQPPAEWLNKQVTLHGGCNKTTRQCDVFQRRVAFGGMGINIPAFNPLFEVQ